MSEIELNNLEIIRGASEAVTALCRLAGLNSRETVIASSYLNEFSCHYDDMRSAALELNYFYDAAIKISEQVPRNELDRAADFFTLSRQIWGALRTQPVSAKPALFSDDSRLLQDLEAADDLLVKQHGTKNYSRCSRWLNASIALTEACFHERESLCHHQILKDLDQTDLAGSLGALTSGAFENNSNVSVIEKENIRYRLLEICKEFSRAEKTPKLEAVRMKLWKFFLQNSPQRFIVSKPASFSSQSKTLYRIITKHYGELSKLYKLHNGLKIAEEKIIPASLQRAAKDLRGDKILRVLQQPQPSLIPNLRQSLKSQSLLKEELRNERLDFKNSTVSQLSVHNQYFTDNKIPAAILNDLRFLTDGAVRYFDRHSTDLKVAISRLSHQNYFSPQEEKLLRRQVWKQTRDLIRLSAMCSFTDKIGFNPNQIKFSHLQSLSDSKVLLRSSDFALVQDLSASFASYAESYTYADEGRGVVSPQYIHLLESLPDTYHKHQIALYSAFGAAVQLQSVREDLSENRYKLTRYLQKEHEELLPPLAEMLTENFGFQLNSYKLAAEMDFALTSERLLPQYLAEKTQPELRELLQKIPVYQQTTVSNRQYINALAFHHQQQVNQYHQKYLASTADLPPEIEHSLLKVSVLKTTEPAAVKSLLQLNRIFRRQQQITRQVKDFQSPQYGVIPDISVNIVRKQFISRS